MKRVSLVLLTAALLAPIACKGEKEVDPAEQEAKLARDLEEAATRLRNNKVADAERLYSNILEEHPEHPQALAGMGKLRYQQSKYEEAETLLEKSASLAADVPETHAMLGEMYAFLDRHEEAAEAYGKAFELDREKSEYGLPYGRELKLSKKYAEAEKVLREVAELDPMARFVYTELGDTLRHQDKLDDALRTYMKAQSTYASDKMARAGAAYVYEAKGDTKHALDEWSGYIRMDCCSEFSNEVAKKKIMELEPPSPEEGEDATASADEEDDPDADQAG